jgi:hypothetical protein
MRYLWRIICKHYIWGLGIFHVQRQFWPNNYKELSASREAACCAAIQQLPCILRNTKAHYRIHKSPARDPIHSHVIPIRTTHPVSPRPILILSIHLYLCLPSVLTLSGLPVIDIYAIPFAPIRATSRAHLLLHCLFTLIKYEDKQMLWSSWYRVKMLPLSIFLRHWESVFFF